MIRIGTIGAKALYLLFLWLISAAAGAWLSDRKGYGERVGLTLGLLLSAVGLLVVSAAARASWFQVAGGWLAAASATGALSRVPCRAARRRIQQVDPAAILSFLDAVGRAS